MRLLKYELYKIFSNKVMYLALVVFMALNFIGINSEYNLKMESCRDAYKPFKRYEGKISDEKIELAQKYEKDVENNPENTNTKNPELYGKTYYTLKVLNIENNKNNYMESLKNINPTEKTE